MQEVKKFFLERKEISILSVITLVLVLVVSFSSFDVDSFFGKFSFGSEEADIPVENENYDCNYIWPQQIIDKTSKEIVWICPMSNPYCKAGTSLCCQYNFDSKTHYDCVNMLTGKAYVEIDTDSDDEQNDEITTNDDEGENDETNNNENDNDEDDTETDEGENVNCSSICKNTGYGQGRGPVILASQCAPPEVYYTGNHNMNCCCTPKPDLFNYQSCQQWGQPMHYSFYAISNDNSTWTDKSCKDYTTLDCNQQNPSKPLGDYNYSKNCCVWWCDQPYPPAAIEYDCDWNWPHSIINKNTKQILWRCSDGTPYRPYCKQGTPRCCNYNDVTKEYYDCLDMKTGEAVAQQTPCERSCISKGYVTGIPSTPYTIECYHAALANSSSGYALWNWGLDECCCWTEVNPTSANDYCVNMRGYEVGGDVADAGGCYAFATQTCPSGNYNYAYFNKYCCVTCN